MCKNPLGNPFLIFPDLAKNPKNVIFLHAFVQKSGYSLLFSRLR